MARSTELGIVYQPATLRPFTSRSAEMRFTTEGTVLQVALPPHTLGVRIYPRTNDVRFALDSPPDPVGIIAHEPQGDPPAPMPAAVTDIIGSNGAIAKANGWTERLLPFDSHKHVLYIRSESGNTTVDVELF